MKPVLIFLIIIALSLTTIFVLRNLNKSTNVIEDVNLTSTTNKALGAEISYGNTAKKQVIFTFDGGSSIQSGQSILNILKKHNVKGTFFLTGKTVTNYPDFVKQIAVQGSEIFNHTYDHKDLTKLSDVEIAAELNGMEKVLQNTVSVSSKPYFRAPYGSRDARVLAAAQNAGYRSVFWTVDAMDWKESRGETTDQVKNIILSNLKPGTIYLMHVGDNITGQILDDVFTQIESKGYKIVSLTQGL